jgi:hypothetical protein
MKNRERLLSTMKKWVGRIVSIGVLAMGGLLMSQSAANAAGVTIMDCSGGATANQSILAQTGPNIGTGNGLQTIEPLTTVTNVQCALEGLPGVDV